MTPFLHGMARAVVETFDLPEPVLEVGSFQVAGQENIAELRGLFPGKEYLGVDVRPGPGVDLVQDVEDMALPDGSVGTVLALSTLEHVPHFWKGLDEIRRVLRPGGALLLACPFYFHVHDYPSDYWRFTPMALEMLLEDYPSKIVGWQGPPTRPANVWALAFRDGRGPIRAPEYDRYRSLMGLYAREPLSWTRRLRYLLGRLLCGRRPFAPWLDREQWQSRCLNREALRRTSAASFWARQTCRRPR